MRNKSQFSDRAEILAQVGQFNTADLILPINCWEFITVQEKFALVSFYSHAQKICFNFENW